MPRTVTNLVSAQAFGDGTPLAAIKQAIASSTSALVIHVKATMTQPSATGIKPLVVFASSPTSYGSAALGKAALTNFAQNLECAMPTTGEYLIEEFVSELHVPIGDWLYLWFDEPSIPEGCTIDVNLIELS